MLQGARVIAVDDKQEDLDGIVQALHKKGVGVLPVLFKGAASLRPCLPGIRVVFTDINMAASAAQPYQQHQGVASILNALLDPNNGPWIMVAWTAAPDQTEALKTVLKDSLGKERAPITAIGLNKAHYMNAKGVYQIPKIAAAIDKHISENAVAGAILDLELRSSQAAYDVTQSIIALTPTAAPGEIAQVLVELSKATNPNPPFTVENVMQTIGPVLQDRLIRRGVSKAETVMWDQAFAASAGPALLPAHRAELNSAVHLDPNTAAGDRGAITIVPTAVMEKAMPGLSSLVFDHFLKQEKAISILKTRKRAALPPPAHNQPAPPLPADDVLITEFYGQLKWGMLELAPACDAANGKRGLRRAAVILIVPGEYAKLDTAGDHAQKLPLLKLGNDVVLIFVSAKTTVSPVPKTLAKLKPGLRMRDQLLDGLTQNISGSQARIGWVSF
ncbi:MULTISPECIES: hypothetical protein [unclassified Bradyrhizobium]|uniref:hypothetical protein n=1 Tax=unclassified Bradyrhizobium TaxID=2631580 RepID=UPI001FF85F7C|nr:MULTISPECIES: hypothetical protein [unclassified Bradyrhizobium]MCK1289382.1 hypothetical protein [Bradyrhizobium sp. 30]MCK1497900.1 hypothetical protein [Bradyrhizobium sp. 188]